MSIALYQVNTPAPALPSNLVDLMTRTETATIGHILHDGFCDPALAPVVAGRRVAGTAFTVRIPGMDSATLHYALSMARPGDVIVIDRAGDDTHACWGGVVTLAAKLVGIAAAVIDGRATDFSEIRSHDMPVWCRGTSSKTTKFVGLGGAINIPVSVGGVTVAPGDGVLCDENGVVVLKPEQIVPVCSRAIVMQENEEAVIASLRRGERLSDISGATAMIEGQ